MKKTIGIIGGELQGTALAQDALRFAENFRQERLLQYNRDRTDALRRLDIDLWKTFAWRWNIAPPYPRGWGTDDDMLAVMHRTRLMLHEFSEQERIFSAAFLVGHSIPLPEGLTFEDGKLVGEAIQPLPPSAARPR